MNYADLQLNFLSKTGSSKAATNPTSSFNSLQMVSLPHPAFVQPDVRQKLTMVMSPGLDGLLQ